MRMRLKHSWNDEFVCQTINRLRLLLEDVGFVGRHKARTEDFTRQRTLGFARVITLLLQKTLQSVQVHLNGFFDRLDQGLTSVTASAWCQARMKLRHTALIELNEQTILAPFYEGVSVRRWRGHRLLAIDSSLLCLPTQPEMGQEFGWVENSNQSGECGRTVQGRLSVLTDLLNDLALQTLLVHPATGERTLAAEHLAALRPGDVGVMDRGFAGYELWARWQARGRDFVCRCPGGGFGVVNDLLAENVAGRSVTVSLRPARAVLQEVRQWGLPETIRVRFLTVRLSTGELEVLGTSLVDEQAYPTEEFGEVYHRRWGLETYYGLLKGRLALENFSGESVEAVRQDLHATVMLSNLETLLTASTQARLEEETATAGKPAYQVNRAVSIHTIKTHLLELLLSRQPAQEVIGQMRRLFNGAPVLRRPGRKPPRRRKSAWRSYRFQRYVRKVVF